MAFSPDYFSSYKGIADIVIEIHKEMPHLTKAKIRTIIQRYCREIHKRASYKSTVTIHGFGAFVPNQQGIAKRKNELKKRKKKFRTRMKRRFKLDDKARDIRRRAANKIRDEYILMTFYESLQKKEK